MGTVQSFNQLVAKRGSSAIFHRQDSIVPCPCLTPEGFRDPEWHEINSTAQVCNEQGMLIDPAHTVDLVVKAFIQPIQSTRATRLQTEMFVQMFGTIQADDHLGLFPEAWSGISLDFYNWSQSGEDYIIYNNRRYTSVNSNLIPDPDDGNPRHHWECGLRLISTP